MEYDQAIAFVLFATAAAITPGPSNVVLTATGALVGLVRGIPCLLGVAGGMGLMMSVVGLGLGAVVLGEPVVLGAIKWCGIAFLLWLAWKIATAPAAADGAESPGGRPMGFFGAMALQWVNPKSWLVSVSAVGAYLRAGSDLIAQALTIAILFFLVALVTGAVWLSFGTALRTFLRDRGRRRAFNLCMGALLALSAVLFV